jgi:hypothetical protein
MNKRLLSSILIFASIFTCSFAKANGITDTLHVRHYNISITELNNTLNTLKGITEVNIESKVNGVNIIKLSLLKLNIDSIKYGNQTLTYSYNDTTIKINSPITLNTNDSITIAIAYHGVPKQDPTFGGFTFNGDYAFNIGVGFDAKPHNLGKAWFACLDEFTDRATYEFHITTLAKYKAYCNGTLQSTINNGNGTLTYNWTLQHNIPTYLAAVAVAPYVNLHKSYKGIPIQWGVLAADSAKTKITFAKIDTAMSAFIKAYGAYPWEKVGYMAVPFNGGAMEHATSIHVGNVFIDGTLTYETLWAHELSHMWWGDKVTCETAGDMWLNEGFASFNENLFTEAAYGQTAYKDAVRANHRQVLQFSHIKDGQYFPMNNIPHDYTYGFTVYKKGEDVIHTLRKYMGDSVFFKGCRDYLAAHAYGNANSYQLRDALTASSGVDMTRFFDDWIFNPGFAHFSIDSTKITPQLAGSIISVYTRQRAKGTTHIYKMPVECRLTDGVHDTTVVVNIDAATNKFDILLAFNPTWIALDRNEKIGDAIADYEKTISTIGTQNFKETNVVLAVANVGANPSTIRIEHNFVAPDGFINNTGKYSISDYHYWKIDGIIKPGFLCSGTFTYDGRQRTTTGYLDDTFIKGKEDSLALLYRKGPGHEWTIAKHQTLIKGSPNDKVGSIKVDSLLLGEYALGNKNIVSALPKLKDIKTGSLNIYPNPFDENTTFSYSLPQSPTTASLQIYDITGKEVFKYNLGNHTENTINIPFGNLPKGVYICKLLADGHILETKKMVRK